MSRRHAATRARRDTVLGWCLIGGGIAVAAAGLFCLAVYRAAGDGTWLSGALHFLGFASVTVASTLGGTGTRALRRRAPIRGASDDR